MARIQPTEATFDANFFFFGSRNNSLGTGISASLLKDPVVNKAVASAVVGGQSREGVPHDGATILPSVIGDRPRLNEKGNRLIRGSVIPQEVDKNKKRNVIVSHRTGTGWIVLVRAGFQFGDEGLTGDVMKILDSGRDVVRAGSFSFHKGSGARNVAKGRDQLALFGNQRAILLDNIPSRRKIPALGDMLAVEWDLWEIPDGAIVLVRDPNGQVTRLIGGKASCIVEVFSPEEAAMFDDFFGVLFDERDELLKELGKQRAQKRLGSRDADDAART